MAGKDLTELFKAKIDIIMGSEKLKNKDKYIFIDRAQRLTKSKSLDSSDKLIELESLVEEYNLIIN